MQDVQEYSVRVSFLELYNEELFDLLSTTDDNTKLRIFEDSARKVHQYVFVICDPAMIYMYTVWSRAV